MVHLAISTLVRSPPEPWEVTDPGFSVWVKAKRLPWRLGPTQKAQRSWGEGLAFSYALLTFPASLVYLRPRDSTILPPAALCWFMERWKAHVFTTGAWLHSPAAAWVWRLNPGLVGSVTQAAQAVACLWSRLPGTFSVSKLGAHISRRGLGCPGECELLYEATFTREYGAIPERQYLVGRKTNL